MRAALLALALLAAAPGVRCDAARAQQAPAPAAQDAQTLFDEAESAAAAGDKARAVDRYAAALRVLQAQGRGDGADAGLVAVRLGRALDALDHPRAEETLRFALARLDGASDPAPFLDAARILLRRLAAKEPDQARAVIDRAVARLARGTSRATRDAALSTLLNAVAEAGRADLRADVYARFGGLDGDDETLALVRAMAPAERAKTAEREGRFAEAVELIDEAIRRFRRPGLERGLALALGVKARIAYASGGYAEGLAVAAEAETLLRANPKDRAQWAEALGLKARLLERLERPAEAVAALEAAETVLDPASDSDATFRDAMRLDRVGFLRRAGRVGEARALLEGESERHGGKASWLIAGAYFDQAAGLDLADNDFAAAREAARRAVAIYAEKAPQLPALRLEPSRKLVAALTGAGAAAEAESAAKAMIALSEGVFSPSHPEVARDLSDYASLLREQDRPAEAEPVERRIAAILARAYGEDAPKHAYALGNLALTILAQGRVEEARAMLERVGAMLARASGAGVAAKRVQALALLAETERLAGRPRVALARLEEAAAIVRGNPDIEVTFAIKSVVDGPAAAALLDLGEAAQAWRLAQEILATPAPSREDAANANKTRVVAAVIAERRGDLDAALRLAREAGAEAERIGQTDRPFVSEWAGLLARFAWRAAAGAAPKAQGPPR